MCPYELAFSVTFITCPFVCVCAGFDLCEVGQEEVVLKTGKLANRRTLHFALQSLLALFGKHRSCSLHHFCHS